MHFSAASIALRRLRALATTAAAMQLRRVQTRSVVAATSASSASLGAPSRTDESDHVPRSADTKPAKAASKRRSAKTPGASLPAGADDDGTAPQSSKKAKTTRASAPKKAVSKSAVMPIVAAAVSDSVDRKIVYTYEHLVPGRLVRRYKRFLADVELVEAVDDPLNAAHDAEPVNPANVVTVHCPNTGPMVGLLDLPNARVQLSKSADPKRKYAYTLEMIQVDNGERRVWVGVHSTLANRMVERAIAAQWLPELGLFASFQREVKFATNSRVDFVLTGETPSASVESEDDSATASGAAVRQKYVEVKSVSFAHPLSAAEASSLSDCAAPDVPQRCALFPDTVSDRAQKHVTELTELVEKSGRSVRATDTAAAIVFLVQRDDCHAFAPSFVHDVAFADLCASAAASGIQLLAYAVALEPQERQKCGHVRLLSALPLFDRAVHSDGASDEADGECVHEATEAT